MSQALGERQEDSCRVCDLPFICSFPPLPCPHTAIIEFFQFFFFFWLEKLSLRGQPFCSPVRCGKGAVISDTDHWFYPLPYLSCLTHITPISPLLGISKSHTFSHLPRKLPSPVGSGLHILDCSLPALHPLSFQNQVVISSFLQSPYHPLHLLWIIHLYSSTVTSMKSRRKRR